MSAAQKREQVPCISQLSASHWQPDAVREPGLGRHTFSQRSPHPANVKCERESEVCDVVLYSGLVSRRRGLALEVTAHPGFRWTATTHLSQLGTSDGDEMMTVIVDRSIGGYCR
jgi:hypothetical protein